MVYNGRMLKYTELHKKRKDFLSATGLYPEEAEGLLVEFIAAYQVVYPASTTLEGKPRQRGVGGGAKGKLATMSDKLLFMLVYDKTYPLQTMQGLHFDLSQGRTNYWLHHLQPVLRHALAALGMTPLREGAELAESLRLNETPADYLIDGTERRRQRPQDSTEQGDHYSGKQHAHTDKNLLLVNTQTDRVEYLSPTEPGKVHDKKLADQAEISLPSGATLGKDTGFQGYEPIPLTFQPKKKPKGKALDGCDQFLNRIFSAIRIAVEHVIAGVKRCRIVKDVLRNTKDGFSDLIIEIACALHNFRVDCRHPLPAFNLLDLCT